MQQHSPELPDSSTCELHVLVFGPQAQSVDTERLVIAGIHFPITADALMSKIAEAYPDLAPSLGVSRIAINHAFAAPDSPIACGDEVALVGLISGG